VQPAHDVDEVRAEQRLSPGEADLGHTQGDEDAGQPNDLVGAELLTDGKESVARTIVVPRHAVGTAEVAAIGDRYAQVA
jgi:hypothetical protein